MRNATTGHYSRVPTASKGHYTGQVVQGLWGGGRAGSVGAVEGVGVGQVVQGLWGEGDGTAGLQPAH